MCSIRKDVILKATHRVHFLKTFVHGVLNYKFLTSKLTGVFGREAQGSLAILMESDQLPVGQQIIFD